MEKASPHTQIQQLFILNDRYNYQKFGFESNGFQETLGTFIRQEQTRRKNASMPHHLPIEKVCNVHGKHSRISLLEPHINAAAIQFHADLPQAFYVQADEYNGHRTNHDDGLDALASCIEMIHNSQKPQRPIKSISNRTFGRRMQ